MFSRIAMNVKSRLRNAKKLQTFPRNTYKQMLLEKSPSDAKIKSE